MRHIRLYENFSKSFYHGSEKEFPLGFILKPQNIFTGHSYNQRIEDLFEKYRPSNKLSRRKSLYLVDDIDLIDAAGGYTDYIYEVGPIGREPEASDLAWYSDVVTGIITDEKPDFSIETMIENYWNGVPYVNKENSLFEYRCEAAKIISIIDEAY